MPVRYRENGCFHRRAALRKPPPCSPVSIVPERWWPGRSADPRALVDRDDADAALVDADRAQRSLHDLDAAVKVERHAERENERRADHVAVADDDRGRVAVALGDVEDRLDGAVLHRPHRLAAGNPR